jgi:hypothetical protein
MDFQKTVRASVYGPEYYASLAGKPLSYSIKYFFALIAWVAVVAAVIMLFSIVPAVHSFLANASQKVIGYYPDGLQVAITNGKVSANVPQPYFLKLPAEFQTSASQAYDASSSPENLLVVDAKDPFTMGEFQNDRTLFLLTGDSIVYAKDRQSQSLVVQSLGSISSLDITKGSVASFIQKAEPYFRLIEWAVAILVPVVIFLAFALRLLYLFIIALLIWILARMSKMNIGYGQAYRWGLHLVTLPLLVTTALWLVVPGASIPFLFTVLTLIMAAVNLKGSSSPRVAAL